jgi:hypothetical protein
MNNIEYNNNLMIKQKKKLIYLTNHFLKIMIESQIHLKFL